MYQNIDELVLASRSPRRHLLLEQMGIKFQLDSADIDEIELPDEPPVDFVQRMALEKAFAVAGRHSQSWILSADTIVVLDNKILGKPVDKFAAVKMLGSMAGQWHHVLTAFTLHHQRRKITHTQFDSSRVKIASLSDKQIEAYVATGEPLDKAGSYAVQGVGGAFVAAIEGSPTTVIGLPMTPLIRDLLKFKIIGLRV